MLTPEYTPSGLRRVPSATRLWFAAPRHLARQVGELVGRSSSLPRLHGSCGRRGDDGGCGVLHATRLSRSCSRGDRACGTATVGGGARCTSARVRAPVKGPLTSCERRSDKYQLATYLTHERKPTPVALSRLWWLSPAESRLRSHPRLYISVSPTLRGPVGNKTFSFVTR